MTNTVVETNITNKNFKDFTKLLNIALNDFFTYENEENKKEVDKKDNQKVSKEA